MKGEERRSLEDIESKVEHVMTIIIMCAGAVIVLVVVIVMVCMLLWLIWQF